MQTIFFRLLLVSVKVAWLQFGDDETEEEEYFPIQVSMEIALKENGHLNQNN